MADLVLGPMLRYVSDTSATIWVETDRRCNVEVLGRSVPTFCIAGHHYALLIIEDLSPSSSTEYQVALDGDVRWPPIDSSLPPSRIRTLDRDSPKRLVFGSCRTAAPHDAPWSLELTLDSRGRGVDALYAYALAMTQRSPDEWPDLAVFVGDQIYADDSSPTARARIAEARRDRPYDPEKDLPPELVGGFEEYTWLYHESWSSEIERWFLANVPSVMIFDDHDMIDDWNISDSWVKEIKTKQWWPEHVLGGLMTYWLYQHLGNLSPDTIRSEGLLERLSKLDDGHDALRDWATHAEEFSEPDHNYPFCVVRDIGRVRLVTVDCRNDRALDPGNRRMVRADEWKWIAEACSADVDHLLIATSLPVFVPGGLHDMEVWSEAVCDGAWGRLGRKIGNWLRVKADMEDWAAFAASFEQFVELLGALASKGSSPTTISVLSGDIHFSYAAEVRFPDRSVTSSSVHQLVSSPIRNALRPPESTAMRLATSRAARHLGALLRRLIHRKPPTVSWQPDVGPVFANTLGELTFDGRAAHFRLLQARPHDPQGDPELDLAFHTDLVAGARSNPDPS